MKTTQGTAQTKNTKVEQGEPTDNKLVNEEVGTTKMKTQSCTSYKNIYIKAIISNLLDIKMKKGH